jgi:hypothetical protein
MKMTFHAIGNKRLCHFYSIDIEEREDVLPYAIRRFGSDIIHCPHCGA